jgi:hypothetical protein
MGEFVPVSDDAEIMLHHRRRRTYVAMIVSAVLLAVIGSPLLMTGCAVFVNSAATGELATAHSSLACFVRLAASAVPLAMAGFVWHRACELERILHAEDSARHSRE